ncbi:hypothetical protein ACUXVT_11310 [Acinetobacter soli]|uniref:hypothetical protein n=1 Tax=Acinetobacter soli TaxID=487316 RepID=UPI0040562CC8
MKKYFEDEKGRELELIVEDDCVTAYHHGKKIGEIAFGSEEIEKGAGHIDSKSYLYSMNVNEEYQRSGVAFNMMKAYVDEYGSEFSKPDLDAVGGKDVEAHEYYTSEGRAFISYCIQMNVLQDNPNQEILD